MGGQIGAASQIAVARGAKVSQADDIESGLGALRKGQGADVVMIDTALDIASLTSALSSERISVPVVACGVGDDAQAAVKAIRSGAQEYIPLPPDSDLIAAVLEAVAEDTNRIIHGDPAMEKALKLARQVAKSSASILIVGESGTGKELMAQLIHQRSPRSNAPFIAVNCAAIPENLLESELFGYEKGAFTGAVSRRIGKFEEADGGTLLLDEISEMDLRLQAKLLRAIQEKEIDRIGGKKPVPVDVRILATSNQNLERLVADGNFREDLYFRLNVVTVTIPRLADRPGDIEPLASHFVEKYAEANGLDPLTLAPEVLESLKSHAWPGNVRELENTIHRGVLLSEDGLIGPDAIQIQTANMSPAGAAGGINLVGRTVADVEKDLIIDTLDHCLGNRTHAAKILGISIRTLRNKLRQYNDNGIAVPMPNEGIQRPSA
jgi:DNA-binding NtrC family response regulator|tara:strand:- start:3176 stop:4483 length:1308 start_codon:yes stop_codon:yes gene_type:complete